MDPLQPGGQEAPKESIKCFGVDMVKVSRKIWQWWVLTKLSLREVVEKLLGDPIQDA